MIALYNINYISIGKHILVIIIVFLQFLWYTSHEWTVNNMRPYLYTMVDEATLRDMLQSLQVCIEIPLQITDEAGNTLIAHGAQAHYCKRLAPFLPENDSCVKLHMDAARRAVDLGEPYIFSCHANLNHVVYPLLCDDAFWGAVLGGPFLLGEPDSTILAEVAERYPLPADTLLELYDDLGEIRVINPATATQISKLLYYLFSSLIDNGRQQQHMNRSRQLQQAKINESIQMYKSFGELDSHNYPYDKERALIAKVKAGDVAEAKGILNDLLGYVLFREGSKLDGIKARAIELASLLSRAAIEGGATANSILKMNNSFLLSLSQSEDFDLLCLQLQEIVEAFTETVFSNFPGGNTDSVKRAMAYISRQYHAKVSLEDVAAQVHLNPAYFSTLFSRSTGLTFKEYLNMVRVEEAKRLLSNTDYAIIDIAVAVGFDDQSYFSKVFKKFTGLTPRQYR